MKFATLYCVLSFVTHVTKSAYFILSSPYSIFPILRLINFSHYIYHGKSGFLTNIYVVNKCHSVNNRPVVRKRINLLFSKIWLWKGEVPATLLPLWETLWPMSNKVDVMKFFQSIMIWYMNLLTLSYPLQYVKGRVALLQSKRCCVNSQMSH